MAAFLLRTWGFDAEAHYDIASALEAARFGGPRAALLVGVPEADGLGFARLLRGQPRCGDSVVIAIGRHAAAAERAPGAGAGHYLAGPADPGRLRELLDEAVRRPGPRVVPST
jgi:DNA-binding response OmpR family regulator